jgi:glycerophosphoryl diester phosphodiesterase
LISPFENIDKVARIPDAQPLLYRLRAAWRPNPETTRLECDDGHRREWLVAHRGHAAAFPENSLPALTDALHRGAAWVEVDVQLSADRVPVLCHDPTLVRTAGVQAAPWDYAWDELSTIEVAEIARFGERFRGVFLPSLADAVAVVARWPETGVFVEIKRHSLEHFGHDAVVDAVTSVLAPIGDRAVPISFDPICLDRIRTRRGGRIGWVLRQWDENSRALAESLAPQFLFCNQERIPPAAELWPGPWDWAIYEIADGAQLRHWRGRGCRLFETMRVADLIAADEDAG